MQQIIRLELTEWKDKTDGRKDKMESSFESFP
jgi:hypothetical protein